MKGFLEAIKERKVSSCGGGWGCGYHQESSSCGGGGSCGYPVCGRRFC